MLADAALGQIGQILKGHGNGFDSEAKCARKQNGCSLRPFFSALFAISMPREYNLWVYGLKYPAGGKQL